MERPFRLQPPSPPARALERTRLVARLAQRWDQRLVTVVAGPGFGKTALLVLAMADNARAPRGRDVWLSCEPSDESAAHLVGGLARALELPSDSDLDRILECVWAEAPQPVCFVVDDVHEIRADSDGAAVVARLAVELPGNGHLVLASRDTVPVPKARLAAIGQLVRIAEDDLVLDNAEIDSFARARDVDPAVLRSCGGWPALAELTATAGADLVLDYLWEEVLARLGVERANLLARFAVAGGGGDNVASALAGRSLRVDELVAGVPLVQQTSTGWSALHPLWGPPLRSLLTDAEAADVRRQAAGAHHEAGRFSAAVDLLVEAEAWDRVLAVMRDAVIDRPRLPAAGDFGRWYRNLPAEWRGAPEALLAAGIDVQARTPLEALPTLDAATKGFRAEGDVDGELAAIYHEGVVRWWANDFGGLFALYARADELASTGSIHARLLTAVGSAAIAHLNGDSDAVLSALADIGDDVAADWAAAIHWFRSVAYRRNGDLQRAYQQLEAAPELDGSRPRQQLDIARLRTDWLGGAVDHVLAQLPAFRAYYERTGDRYLLTETTLELATKLAWLGEVEPTADLIAGLEPIIADMPGALARILRLITLAAIEVGAGDETKAAALLRGNSDAAPGRPESWYWRDRAALALVHVLVPESRAAWADEPLGPAHVPGLVLAQALEAARAGDLAPARALDWPDAGVVRAHLPLRWVVELAVTGHAAGNPPPADLLAAVSARVHLQLRALVDRAREPIAATAKVLLAQLPAVPPYRLRIGVLGPLELRRDGGAVEHADLGRQRVRELLCHLVAHRRVRREAVAAELWPELDDPANNLRVTLSYLQRVLQPDRVGGQSPYFIRTEGEWLALTGDDCLEVDTWELEAILDDADRADRANTPAAALASYRKAMPLWHGEPFADVSDASWLHPERTRLRSRYAAAAIRAGELLLAVGEANEARGAARCAIAAEPSAEAAYRLLARAHLAEDDAAGARHAVDDCRAALADLGLEPDSITLALVAETSEAVSEAH